MTEDLKVGEKIKLLREKKKLSLSDLADKSGFSSAVLSQIENHMISPPLGTIIKLAKALEVEPGYFFKEKPKSPYVIVRKDERLSVSRVASKDGVSYGYSYESLGADKKGRKMEPFIVTLDPNPVKKGSQSTHDGEEFIFVLEGEMEVTLGDHSDVLGFGDSIYYDSTIPHRVAAHGDAPAKILAVLWTGTK
jgi:mannose-6-phosphate isomerase-like protein (cupin superfamily)